MKIKIYLILRMLLSLAVLVLIMLYAPAAFANILIFSPVLAFIYMGMALLCVGILLSELADVYNEYTGGK